MTTNKTGYLPFRVCEQDQKHLSSDSRCVFQVRDSLYHTGKDFDSVPVAEILVCCGFFLIYMVEEVVYLITNNGEFSTCSQFLISNLYFFKIFVAIVVNSSNDDSLGHLQRTFSLRGAAAAPATATTGFNATSTNSSTYLGNPQPTNEAASMDSLGHGMKTFFSKLTINYL